MRKHELLRLISKSQSYNPTQIILHAYLEQFIQLIADNDEFLFEHFDLFLQEYFPIFAFTAEEKNLFAQSLYSDHALFYYAISKGKQLAEQASMSLVSSLQNNLSKQNERIPSKEEADHWVKKFKTVKGTDELIATWENAHPTFKAYFLGKSAHFTEGAYQIDLVALQNNFRALLWNRSRYNMLIELMWDDENSPLKNYFCGKPVIFNGIQHQINAKTCLANFYIGLMKPREYIIDAMWTNTPLQSYIQDLPTNAKANLLRRVWYSGTSLINRFLATITDVEVITICLDNIKGTSHAATARKHILEQRRDILLKTDPTPTSAPNTTYSASLKEVLQPHPLYPFMEESLSHEEKSPEIMIPICDLTPEEFLDTFSREDQEETNFSTEKSLTYFKKLLQKQMILSQPNYKLQKHTQLDEIEVARETNLSAIHQCWDTLKDYLSESSFHRINFYELLDIFRMALATKYHFIIDNLWNANPSLQTYFSGQSILWHSTHIEKPGIATVFVNFNKMLSSKNNHVISMMWERSGEELYKYISSSLDIDEQVKILNRILNLGNLIFFKEYLQLVKNSEVLSVFVKPFLSKTDDWSKYKVRLVTNQVNSLRATDVFNGTSWQASSSQHKRSMTLFGAEEKSQAKKQKEATPIETHYAASPYPTFFPPLHDFPDLPDLPLSPLPSLSDHVGDLSDNERDIDILPTLPYSP